MFLSLESSRFIVIVVMGRREGAWGRGLERDRENERKRERGKETEISWFTFRDNSDSNSTSHSQGETGQLDIVLIE